MKDEIIKCTGCEECGAHLDESAGDDVELGKCPDCKYKKDETPPYKRLYCSFCGLCSTEVEKLIAGPLVYICNNCVDLCVHMLRGGDQQTPVDLGLNSLLQERDKLQNDVHALSERVHGHEMRIAANALLLPGVCDGKEQDAFEEWAQFQRMDMQQHPLHWLFLNPVTSAARDGWKAGIEYCRDRLGVTLKESTESGP